MKYTIVMVLVFLVGIVAVFGGENVRNLNLEASYTYLGTTVNNMPLEVRDVPPHDDDSWVYSGRGAIERTKYSCNNGLQFALMYAKEFGYGKDNEPNFNFGIGADWLLMPYLFADRQERNYMGNPGSEDRGYGTALTYLELTQMSFVPSTGMEWVDFFSNWAPRAKLEFAPFGGKLSGVWIGTSVGCYRLVARTGWDRYDSLEVDQNYVLAYQFPVRVYTIFGGDDRGSGFTVGAQFQLKSETELGRQSEIDMPPVTIFLGLAGRM